MFIFKMVTGVLQTGLPRYLKLFLMRVLPGVLVSRFVELFPLCLFDGDRFKYS